jgi:hypothetical protein
MTTELSMTVIKMTIFIAHLYVSQNEPFNLQCLCAIPHTNILREASLRKVVRPTSDHSHELLVLCRSATRDCLYPE